MAAALAMAEPGREVLAMVALAMVALGMVRRAMAEHGTALAEPEEIDPGLEIVQGAQQVEARTLPAEVIVRHEAARVTARQEHAVIAAHAQAAVERQEVAAPLHSAPTSIHLSATLNHLGIAFSPSQARTALGSRWRSTLSRL